jgi:hypothetical protein
MFGGYMPISIPTLSPKGFVSTIADKVDAAMLNFYVSLYSQSNIYRGSNKPLAFLVQQHGESMLGMEEALTTELSTYLSRLFEYAVVNTVGSEEGNSINLRLDIMVRDNGKEYSIGHEILTRNSKIVDIVDIINTGSLIRKSPALFTN